MLRLSSLNISDYTEITKICKKLRRFAAWFKNLWRVHKFVKDASATIAKKFTALAIISEVLLIYGCHGLKLSFMDFIIWINLQHKILV